ncbi:MAG: hypothetical protein QM755_11700 [Luteolibacter sp.]
MDGIGLCVTFVGVVVTVLVGCLMPSPGQSTHTLIWPLLLAVIAAVGILANLASLLLFGILWATKRGTLRLVAIVLNLAMGVMMGWAIDVILTAPNDFRW